MAFPQIQAETDCWHLGFQAPHAAVWECSQIFKTHNETNTGNMMNDQKTFIVMEWMFVLPPPPKKNTYVEAPTPSEIVSGCGAFGRWLGLHEVMRVGSPWWDKHPSKKRKREQGLLSLPYEDTGRGRPTENQKESPHQNPTMLTPWPQTSSLQNCGKMIHGLSHPICGILLCSQRWLRPLPRKKKKKGKQEQSQNDFKMNRVIFFSDNWDDSKHVS